MVVFRFLGLQFEWGGVETQMTGTSENKTKATNSFLTLMIRSFRQREKGREKNKGDRNDVLSRFMS